MVARPRLLSITLGWIERATARPSNNRFAYELLIGTTAIGSWPHIRTQTYVRMNGIILIRGTKNLWSDSSHYQDFRDIRLQYFDVLLPSDDQPRRHQQRTYRWCPLRQIRAGLATETPAREGTTSEEQQQQHVPSSLASGKSVLVFASAMRISRSRSQRPFDVLKGHRSYCPYVVRLTVVPSLPSATAIVTLPISDNGGDLGWRAVLTVIQRHS